MAIHGAGRPGPEEGQQSTEPQAGAENDINRELGVGPSEEGGSTDWMPSLAQDPAVVRVCPIPEEDPVNAAELPTQVSSDDTNGTDEAEATDDLHHVTEAGESHEALMLAQQPGQPDKVFEERASENELIQIDVVSRVHERIEAIIKSAGIDPNIPEIESIIEQALHHAETNQSQHNTRPLSTIERWFPAKIAPNQAQREATSTNEVISMFFMGEQLIDGIAKLVQQTGLVPHEEINAIARPDGSGYDYYLSDEGVRKVRSGKIASRTSQHISFDGTPQSPTLSSDAEMDNTPDSMIETLAIPSSDRTGTLIQLRPSHVGIEAHQIRLGNMTRVNALALTDIGLSAVISAQAERMQELFTSFDMGNGDVDIEAVQSALANLLDRRGPDDVLQHHQRKLGYDPQKAISSTNSQLSPPAVGELSTGDE